MAGRKKASCDRTAHKCSSRREAGKPYMAVPKDRVPTSIRAAAWSMFDGDEKSFRVPRDVIVLFVSTMGMFPILNGGKKKKGGCNTTQISPFSELQYTFTHTHHLPLFFFGREQESYRQRPSRQRGTEKGDRGLDYSGGKFLLRFFKGAGARERAREGEKHKKTPEGGDLFAEQPGDLSSTGDR